MDRLYVVIVALLFLAACDDHANAQKPVTKSRVNAVTAKKNVGDAPDDFCDTYWSSDAPKFAWPPLASKPPFTLSSGIQSNDKPGETRKWKWINVWATWCKPCVEEMPRILQWKSALVSNGLTDVVFVSSDESDQIVADFRAKHPDVPSGPRIVEGLKEWMVAMGFDAGAPLPLHIFIDQNNTVRCVRAGGVSEHNKAAVERLLAQ